jgi:AcrR family transcriptional regulator
MSMTRRPGRPRDESVDTAVITATLDLVEEEGLAAVSMEAIAERAGVSKASIYRRWDGKGELLVDCVAGLVGAVQAPETAAIREVLIRILVQMRSFFTKAKAGQLFPWLVGEMAAGSDLGQRYAETVIIPRRAMVAGLIRDAVERGELRSDLDVDIAVDMLTGPAVMQKLLGAYSPPGDGWEERFVDHLLLGWTP